jgi:hypothetical protein
MAEKRSPAPPNGITLTNSTGGVSPTTLTTITTPAVPIFQGTATDITSPSTVALSTTTEALTATITLTDSTGGVSPTTLTTTIYPIEPILQEGTATDITSPSTAALSTIIETFIIPIMLTDSTGGVSTTTLTTTINLNALILREGASTDITSPSTVALSTRPRCCSSKLSWLNS